MVVAGARDVVAVPSCCSARSAPPSPKLESGTDPPKYAPGAASNTITTVESEVVLALAIPCRLCRWSKTPIPPSEPANAVVKFRFG